LYAIIEGIAGNGEGLGWLSLGDGPIISKRTKMSVMVRISRSCRRAPDRLLGRKFEQDSRCQCARGCADHEISFLRTEVKKSPAHPEPP
jgi:hypothetical protein